MPFYEIKWKNAVFRATKASKWRGGRLWWNASRKHTALKLAFYANTRAHGEPLAWRLLPCNWVCEVQSGGLQTPRPPWTWDWLTVWLTLLSGVITDNCSLRMEELFLRGTDWKQAGTLTHTHTHTRTNTHTHTRARAKYLLFLIPCKLETALMHSGINCLTFCCSGSKICVHLTSLTPVLVVPFNNNNNNCRSHQSS